MSGNEELEGKHTRLGRTEVVVLSNIAEEIHRLNQKWWVDITKPCWVCSGTGTMADVDGGSECIHCGGSGHPPKERNVGEMLMLAVSELAEAMEGHRKNLRDDHLPQYPMMTVEVVDCMIRLFDFASVHCPDFGEALVAKCEYNQSRLDHSIEARLGPDGKKY